MIENKWARVGITATFSAACLAGAGYAVHGEAGLPKSHEIPASLTQESNELDTLINGGVVKVQQGDLKGATIIFTSKEFIQDVTARAEIKNIEGQNTKIVNANSPKENAYLFGGAGALLLGIFGSPFGFITIENRRKRKGKSNIFGAPSPRTSTA
jgi:hypothetical protein